MRFSHSRISKILLVSLFASHASPGRIPVAVRQKSGTAVIMNSSPIGVEGSTGPLSSSSGVNKGDRYSKANEGRRTTGIDARRPAPGEIGPLARLTRFPLGRPLLSVSKYRLPKGRRRGRIGGREQ